VTSAGQLAIAVGAVVAVALIAAVVGFIYWFARDADAKARNRAILFSYSFTFAVIVVPIVAAAGFDFFNRPSAMGVARGCIAPTNEKDALAKADIPAELRCGEADATYAQWVLYVGSWIPDQEQGHPPYKIVGGLVVPVYFVILSLMGAAVSLARRVPEIQKRSAPDYVGTEKEPKLTFAEALEYLAFQIMQFVSAPLIAVTAYYVITPGSRATSATLGFSSGFASEAVLLLIRGAVEKISPAVTPTAASGSATGTVRRANAAVQGVKVGIVGQPSLKTESDATGAFVLNGIPAGEQVIEAADAAGTKLVKVTIEAGKATLCQVDL
jgi:amino acid transporter